MPINKKEQLQLLNQILERAIAEDEEYKRKMVQKHKASKSIGEGWLVYHLKVLKNLIINE